MAATQRFNAAMMARRARGAPWGQTSLPVELQAMRSNRVQLVGIAARFEFFNPSQ